jgi:hypothetical protein
VIGLIVIGVTASLMFYVQTINVLRSSGTMQELRCGPTVLRSPKAWLVGRPAGPDIGPARRVGGPAASVKSPTGGLAKLRIAHAIRVAESLSGISTRCRGIGRRLQGQEACETARCALKKDPRHRSFTLVVCVSSNDNKPALVRLLRRLAECLPHIGSGS